MTKDTCRIVVAGVCASGKSTLVKGLLNLGYQARAVAQEHSYSPKMHRMSQPDFVIVLDAELATVQGRRPIAWDQSRLDVQEERLAFAKDHCDLYLQTDSLTSEDVLEKAVGAIERFITERKSVHDHLE